MSRYLAIIPVFKDDRVIKAIEELNKQTVQFDEIIIQDPVSDYKHLERAGVTVNNDRDVGLFNGIDKCVEKYVTKADFVFLQGADDVLTDYDFVKKAKEHQQDGFDIFASRTAHTQNGVIKRMWPKKEYVESKKCYPAHFGTIYSGRLLKSHKMQIEKHAANIGMDTVWLEKIRFRELKIIQDETLGFFMETGGISTKERLSSLKNIVNVMDMSKKESLDRVKIVKTFFSSLFLKATQKWYEN